MSDTNKCYCGAEVVESGPSYDVWACGAECRGGAMVKACPRLPMALRAELALHKRSTRLLADVARRQIRRYANDNGDINGLVGVTSTERKIIEQIGACGVMYVHRPNPREVVGIWRDEG